MTTSDLKNPLSMPSSTASVLETAQHHFEQAADRLELEDSVRDRLRYPEEQVTLRLHPVMPSSGKLMPITAHIVRHNTSLGPAKGGIRMDESVTVDMIAGLAMEMTWKTALMGLPFGGGKSGIACDPAILSPDDKEVILREFARGGYRHIGPEVYVPAPDMGTSEREMGFLRDSLSRSSGLAITPGSFVTGKPVILGGIEGRSQATGQGIACTVEAACELLKLDISKLTAAVQGFGNVGAAGAMALSQRGIKVIAIADLTGGIHNSGGIDVEALQKHVRATGRIEGFPEGEPIEITKIFETDCEILLPAAGGSQITTNNAGRVKARIIAEGANAPTTPRAEALLEASDVFIIPDILCNAGGVFVSYLEYMQETQREQMTLDIVESRLRERMMQRFTDVLAFAKQRRCSPRVAAMDLAIARVAQGMRARGMRP